MASNIQDSNQDTTHGKEDDDWGIVVCDSVRQDNELELKREALDQDFDPSSPFLMPEVTDVTSLKEEGYNNEETERVMLAPEPSWDITNVDPININDSNDDEYTEQYDNRNNRSVSYMDYDSGDNNDDYGYSSSRKRKRLKKSSSNKRSNKSEATSLERAEPGTGSIEIFNNPKDIYIPDGWTRRVTQRTGGKSAGKFDVLYTDPHGKSFRSKIAILRYYAENDIQNPGIDIEALMFGYGGDKGSAPKLPDHLRMPVPSAPVEKKPSAPVVKKTNKSRRRFRFRLSARRRKKNPEKKSVDKPKEIAENRPKTPEQEKVSECEVEEELFSLKWNNHKSTFFENLKVLKEKSQYTDATLAVDGQFYPVHKLVMSTCSDYFSDIFEKTPCKSPVVVLQNVRCQDMEALLDFMYLGEVNVSQKDIPSLLITAACLKIKGFALPDEEELRSYVSSNNNDVVGQDSSTPIKRKLRSANPVPPRNMTPITSSQKSTATKVNLDKFQSVPPSENERQKSHTRNTRNSRNRSTFAELNPSTLNFDQDEPSNFVQVEMDDDDDGDDVKVEDVTIKENIQKNTRNTKNRATSSRSNPSRHNPKQDKHVNFEQIEMDDDTRKDLTIEENKGKNTRNTKNRSTSSRSNSTRHNPEQEKHVTFVQIEMDDDAREDVLIEGNDQKNTRKNKDGSTPLKSYPLRHDPEEDKHVNFVEIEMEDDAREKVSVEENDDEFTRIKSNSSKSNSSNPNTEQDESISFVQVAMEEDDKVEEVVEEEDKEKYTGDTKDGSASETNSATHNPEQDEPSNFVQVEVHHDAEEEEEVMEENNIESDISHHSDAGDTYNPDSSEEKKNVKFTFEIGHRSKVLQVQTDEGYTHDWEVFVQGNEEASLEFCVEKVVFALHKSFVNHRREVTASPYLVSEKGYGSFTLPIEIFFKTSDNKTQKRRIEYDLELQPLNEAPIEIVKKETFIFVEPSDDFRSKLLAGGGELTNDVNDNEESDEMNVTRNSQDTKRAKKAKRKGGVHWEDSFSDYNSPTEEDDWPLWEPVDENGDPVDENVKPVEQKNDSVDQTSASNVNPVEKINKMIASIVDNYPCTVCSEIFMFPSELRRHMRSHTDDKPYQCLYCGLKMAKNSQLQEHIFSSHPTLRIEKKKDTKKKKTTD